MREILERVRPGAHVSISSEVLPEYREYERAVTTLVDAFVKPRVGRSTSAQIQDAARRGASAAATPFYIMKSNGGVISAARGGAPADHDDLERPAAGALGASAAGAARRASSAS